MLSAELKRAEAEFVRADKELHDAYETHIRNLEAHVELLEQRLRIAVEALEKIQSASHHVGMRETGQTFHTIASKALTKLELP